MACGKKTGGSNFKPGNKLGKGRPKFPAEVKQRSKITREHYREMLNTLFVTRRKDLKTILADPEASVIETWVATIADRAISRADVYALETLLIRLIGRVPERVEHDGIPGNIGAQVVVFLPSNGKETAGSISVDQPAITEKV
jgi:hypothetical protein